MRKLILALVIKWLQTSGPSPRLESWIFDQNEIPEICKRSEVRVTIQLKEKSAP